MKIEDLRALLSKAEEKGGALPWRAADPSNVGQVAVAEVFNAMPALLDMADAAGVVVAGFRRPQAVAPERWYAAMETMRAALARLAE